MLKICLVIAVLCCSGCASMREKFNSPEMQQFAGSLTEWNQNQQAQIKAEQDLERERFEARRRAQASAPVVNVNYPRNTNCRMIGNTMSCQSY